MQEREKIKIIERKKVNEFIYLALLDMANIPQIACNAGCCLNGHPSKYWIGLSLLNFGNLVFSVDFYEKKKICLDMANMPQIAYNAGCCLTGHPSKYWIGLSLLNFGNLVFSVDFYMTKKENLLRYVATILWKKENLVAN